MVDFAELRGRGPGRIQAGLDIRAVAAVYGVSFDSPDGLAKCPFHPDNTASLNVFIGDTDGKQRWHCHGCGQRGDVIDFVQQSEDLTYAQALDRCTEFLAQGLPAPTPVDRGPAPDLAALMRDTASEGREPLLEFLADRASPIAPAWLTERFRLAVNRAGEIVIPHYQRGVDTPTAVKRRSGSAKAAYSGSRLTALYGDWLDQGRPDVVLCEGESDTWTVAWHLKDARVDVLGLPRGVGSRIETDWLDILAGRTVTLCFDADGAGRTGMRRWAEALTSRGCTVRLALLPETCDASSSGESALLDALRRAVDAPDLGGLPVFRHDGRYCTRKGTGDEEKVTPITDWSLELLERIEVLGESVHYAVRLPSGDETRISHSDLRNADAFARWANRWGLTHSAAGAATQGLLRLFEAEAVFIPRRTGVGTVGLHDWRFVLPDRTIGRQDVRYVAPAMNVRWETLLAFGEEVSHPQLSVLPVLARMMHPAVMTPILGWTAAAPLRALCAQFPTLAVMGSAGSGKTTVVSTVMQTFGFYDGTPVTVSNSTWHAVMAMASSTNAIPTWFDEFREGVRSDGKAAVEQVIRDAWNGSATLRGGGGDNRLGLISMVATAPLLISGEGDFQEQSHAERMVYVPITRDGRNHAALEEWQSLSHAGVGLAYLNWLVRQAGNIPAPPALTERPAQAVAVARWGYSVLLDFLADHGLEDRMPAWDESLIRNKQTDLLSRNPYMEALRECYNATDGDIVLVVGDGEDVIVRYGRIPTYIRKNTSIVLPGGERALLDWMSETFDVLPHGQRSVRLAGARGRLNV